MGKLTSFRLGRFQQQTIELPEGQPYRNAGLKINTSSLQISHWFSLILQWFSGHSQAMSWMRSPCVPCVAGVNMPKMFRVESSGFLRCPIFWHNLSWYLTKIQKNRTCLGVLVFRHRFSTGIIHIPSAKRWQTTMENHHAITGNIHYTWPCSIAM